MSARFPSSLPGLAVALGFKAGVFNIGAEGQIYAGAIMVIIIGGAATLQHYPEQFDAPPILNALAIFANLPPLILIPLVILGGILGGFLWGAIPGALKAFTGAHEVITTIMLNFIAILLVDWLIKSTSPVLLGVSEEISSLPKTVEIIEGARIPSLAILNTALPILLGLVIIWAITFLLNYLSSRRELANSGMELVNSANVLPIFLGVFALILAFLHQHITLT